jgi:hypothetical protein
VKLYTYRILSAETDADFPLDMAEKLVSVLLDLVDDIGKGKPPKRKFENVCDYCTEARSMNESTFALMFGKKRERRRRRRRRRRSCC